MSFYSIPDYYHKGCYKDGRPRTLRKYLGKFKGPDAIQQCYEQTKQRGFKAFGLQKGGKCYSGRRALKRFNKYNTSSNCKNGVGGPSANDVYFVNPMDQLYRNVGCFKDKKNNRALPELLGTFDKNAVNR